MPRLVSLVGLTPGVTHTALCLLARQGVPIGEVVVVGTQPEVLEEAVRIASQCPCPGVDKPYPSFRTVLLDFPDIRSESDLARLGETLRSILGRGDYLDITGGRKIMSAWAAIVALNQRAHVVASIVPREEIERAQKAQDLCGKTVGRAHLVRLA